jgi:hypothetical protein
MTSSPGDGPTEIWVLGRFGVPDVIFVPGDPAQQAAAEPDPEPEPEAEP